MEGIRAEEAVLGGSSGLKTLFTGHIIGALESILKATGYRILEHHESWREAGDTGFECLPYGQ